MLLIIVQTFQTDDCSICVKQMKHVYALQEREDSKKSEIVAATVQICEMLPTPLTGQQCATFIEHEYKDLYEWVITVNSSDMFCTLMNACEYQIPPISGACDACLVGFEFIDDLFDMGPPKFMIEAGLNYMCHIFSEGDLRAQCEDMLDKQSDKLVEWVGKRLPRNYICTAAGACDFPVDPIEDGLCIFCEGALVFVSEVVYFDYHDGNHFIFVVLDYVCEVFEAGPSKQLCQEFVDTEYEKLADFVEHEFPAESICALAGACPQNITTQYENECEFCSIFYQFALDLLDFEATIDGVESLLKYVCDVFPPALEVACNKFADKFYKKLLEFLYYQFNTVEACQMMGACTN